MEQMTDVFISYTRPERRIAEALRDRVAARGLTTYLDVDHIRGGQRFPDEISQAIERCGKVLALWSSRYFESEWCLRESNQAAKENKLLPIRIERFDLAIIPNEFENLHFHDLSNWTGSEVAEPWQRVLDELGVKHQPSIRDEIASLPTEVRPTFIRIPPGCFLMGSPPNEGASNERPQRLVSFDKPFGLCTTPVTFAMWDAALAAGARLHVPRDGYGWGRGDRPVTNVSRDDIQAYIAWLNAQLAMWVGNTSAPYRLPTEAEWEYACRAGADAAYSTGATISSTQALFMPEGTKRGMRGVASYPPNRFGLYDMHGLIWEHVEDFWGTYPSDPSDGRALKTGNSGKFPIRGGALDAPAGWLRSAFRLQSDGGRDVRTGFRIARTL
jgi:formylglycine-generating enzyme required for sulfatase activity